MDNKRVVILAGEKWVTNIIYNGLKDDLAIEKVIIEQPISRALFLKRRVKRLGAWKVVGQILFKFIVVALLKATSQRRIRELSKKFNLDADPIESTKMMRVPSINSEQTKKLLKELQPGCVVVTGTRIISGEILECIAAKFINIHVGITPLYRGVHGAYWALVRNDRKACGVTVHLVDKGIDTGGILEQGVISPSAEDNFVTYGLHQLAVGIPLLKKAVKAVLENRIEIKPNPPGESQLWTHPTIWGYLWYRGLYGVK